jgi:hypothetical protein
MPFDEEKEDISQNRKIGLKQQPQKSIFDNIPKKPPVEEFNSKVKESYKTNLSNKDKIQKSIEKFVFFLKDKTLEENKTIFQKSSEKDVLIELLQSAMDLNQDENEQPGTGTLTLASTLIKVCLHQKDRINSLEYRLENLEKIIKDKK